LISSSRSPALLLFSYCAPYESVVLGAFKSRQTTYPLIIRITNVANPVKVKMMVQMATIHSVIAGFCPAFGLLFFTKAASWQAGLA
jgi:hypothetical protein